MRKRTTIAALSVGVALALAACSNSNTDNATTSAPWARIRATG